MAQAEWTISIQTCLFDMSTETTSFAAESGHWYQADGSACYTVVGKNGKERPTTLRDARTMGLVPSVTGIIKMAAAPALERWKRNQVLLAALTLPRIDGESETGWLARVEQDWQQQGRAAADRGTAIHGAIEKFYRGLDDDRGFIEYAHAAHFHITQSCGVQNWSAERSFAHPLGYGGKTDLHSSEWVIDVKTKDGDLSKVELYDDHHMQLSVYRRGLLLPTARCGILFVSRDTPVAKFIEVPEEDLVRGEKMFDALLTFWKAKNRVMT